MPERDDTPFEPPDCSSYRMPRLPMVRRLMSVGILLFVAGVVTIVVEAASGLRLFILASCLIGAGFLITAVGFFAETFFGALLKPEDESGGGEPNKPGDRGAG